MNSTTQNKILKKIYLFNWVFIKIIIYAEYDEGVGSVKLPYQMSLVFLGEIVKIKMIMLCARFMINHMQQVKILKIFMIFIVKIYVI